MFERKKKKERMDASFLIVLLMEVLVMLVACQTMFCNTTCQRLVVFICTSRSMLFESVENKHIELLWPLGEM